MKIKLISVIALCFIAFNGAYSAEVGFFVGDVKGDRKGKQFKVNMGLALEAGDIIRTGSKSTLEIRYKNRTSITLSENTVVKIGNANVASSDEVTVVSGRASAVFPKGTKGTNKVYTPTTVAAVRGTKFTVDVDKGNSTIVLNEGKLDVNNPYSRLSMNAGDNVKSDVGEKIEKSNQPSKELSEAVADLNKAIGAFNKYVNDLDSSSKTQSDQMKKYSDEIKSSTTEGEIRNTGRSIEELEELLKDELFLTGGTDYSLKLIMDDLPNKTSKEFRDFAKIKEKSNKVAAQKARNYAEIQAVKQQHKEAVEKIRGKFDADRSNIRDAVRKQKEKNQ